MEVIPMPEEPDTLQEVFGVEQEISGKLAAERAQANQWLDRTRHEIEQATQSELARLKASAAQDEEAAARTVRERTAATLAQARTAIARANTLEDAALMPVVRQRLAAILPGGGR